MPSPRAVLNDIADLGLDPNKKHASLTKSGKLKTASSSKVNVFETVKQNVEVLTEPSTESVTEIAFQDKIAESEVEVKQAKLPVVSEKKKGKFTKKSTSNNN